MGSMTLRQPLPAGSNGAASRRWLDRTNRCLKPAGLALLPLWRFAAPSFDLWGHRFEQFCHLYNCGFPPARMTERSVELAVADRWLSKVVRDDVCEIGAVSPYYWPYRVACVIDLFDPHPLTSRRCSLFDVDLSGRDVIAISTLEHVGLADYGPAQRSETVEAAFEKIHGESRRFLITVPFGLNPAADGLFFGQNESFGHGVRIAYLARGSSDNIWTEVSKQDARRPYGMVVAERPELPSMDGVCANGIAVIERGEII